jgi:myosin heavy subunit
MKNSIYQQAADFLSKAKELGITLEVDRRIQERNNEKRLARIAELHALPQESKTELPKLETLCINAAARLEKAERELIEARDALNTLRQRAGGTRSKFENSRNRLEDSIKELAPEFMKTAFRDLEFLWQEGRHLTASTIETSRNWLGQKTTNYRTNADSVNVLLQDIKAAKQKIELMSLTSASLDRLQSETDDLVNACLDQACSLGMDRTVYEMRNDRAEASAGKRARDAAVQQANGLHILAGNGEVANV